MAEQNARDSAFQMLEQCKNVLDSRIMEINKIVQQIAFDTRIGKMIDRGTSSSNTFFDYWDACKELSKYKFTNSFIDSFYTVNKNGKVIISDGFAVDNLAFFYKNNLKYDGIDYTKWQDNIWSRYYHGYLQTASTILRNDRQERVVTYLQSLPMDTGDTSQAVVVILINEKEFHKLLGSFADHGGWAYRANEKGDIITSLIKGGQSLIPPQTVKETGNSANIKNKEGILFHNVIKLRIFDIKHSKVL